MRRKEKKQGFTIIELLVGVTSAAVLVLTLAAIMVGPLRALATNREYSDIRRDMAYSIAMIGRDVRVSSWSSLSSATNVLTFGGNSVQTNVSVYSLSGDVLERYVNGVKQDDLMDGVTAFTNGVVNAGGVQGVRIYLSAANDDGSISVTHESFIYPRN